MKSTAAMSNFQEVIFLTSMVVAVSWATIENPEPGDAGYRVNTTDLSWMSEGETLLNHISSNVDRCKRKGRPTAACNIAGGFCVHHRSECNGTIDRRSCRRNGCKCCMPWVLPDCHPTSSCCSAGGYCVKNDANCPGVLDPQGCKGAAGCKCCIPSDYDLPWVYRNESLLWYLNDSLPWAYVGGDAFVPFPDPMSWYNAQALCRSYGLNLYRPHNIIDVAEYLEVVIGAGNGGTDYYWLGAKGDENNQVWFNGEGLSWADPWWVPSISYNNGTNDCLGLITWNYNWEYGTVLFANIDSCDGYLNTKPLCG